MDYNTLKGADKATSVDEFRRSSLSSKETTNLQPSNWEPHELEGRSSSEPLLSRSHRSSSVQFHNRPLEFEQKKIRRRSYLPATPRHRSVHSLDSRLAFVHSFVSTGSVTRTSITPETTANLMGKPWDKLGTAVGKKEPHSATTVDTQSLAMPARIESAGLFAASPAPSSSRASRNRSISEYSPSITSSDGTRRKDKTGSREAKQKDGKGRWLSQVKEWFSAGEPSAHDWKQFKKEEYQRRGISMGDPNAQAKMHAPIGQIPKSATKPSGGPDPAKMARKRAEQRLNSPSYAGTPPKTAQSISSGSTSSFKDRNIIAPWAS